VRVVAALYAVIGTGYSFRFVPGGLDPFGPAGSVLPSYLAALVGTYVWTWPPRRRPAVGPRPEAVQAGEAADPLAEGSAASAPRSADSGVPRRR